MTDNYALYALTEICCIFCCCQTIKQAADHIDDSTPKNTSTESCCIFCF